MLVRVLAGALALPLVSFAATAGAASLQPGPSTEIPGPPNAELAGLLGAHALPVELAHLSGLACSPASSCAAVGRYVDASVHAPHAMAVSESGGVWGRAVEITPPPDAPESADARLDAVACPAPGACVATGLYTGTPMAVSQTAGVWGRAVRLPGRFFYSSLACDAPGSCVAVGASDAGLIAVKLSAGGWGAATEITMPPDALSYQVTLAGVACTLSARCVAVGRYAVAGGATRPFAVSETGGTWGAAQAVALAPAMAGDLAVALSAVACPAADPCVAVGADTSRAGRDVPISTASAAGAFGPLTILAPPPGRPAPLDSGLDAVACSATGRCAAVGAQRDTEALVSALAVTGSGGAWGPTSVISHMPDASSRDIAQLHRVACDGSGSCMALGTYVPRAGGTPAMAVSESGGTWSAPTLVTGPPGSRGANVELLACPGSGPCVSVGTYDDGHGNTRLMSAGSTPTPYVAPPATGTLRLVASTIATRAGGRATIRIRCTGTASCVGRLRLTARRPATRTRRAGRTSVVARKTFTIAPGTTGRVAIRLRSGGRGLLRAARSHLNATLTVLKTSPAPSHATTRRIRLTKPRR